MNLDDYDKVPCSAKEANEWMCLGNYSQRVGSLDQTFWFKLVPKKKGLSEIATESLEKAVEKHYPKPDRFAKLDKIIEDYAEKYSYIIAPEWVETTKAINRENSKAIHRAIVEIIEGGKMKYEITITRIKESTEADKYPSHTEIYKRIVSAVDIAAISTVVEKFERYQQQAGEILPLTKEQWEELTK